MSPVSRYLYPDVLFDTADDVPYEALYEEGYRLVLLDIDNTIVPHGAPADAHAIALFQRIHDAGLKTVLLSNNQKERVTSFARDVKSACIHKAGKPAKRSFVKAMERYGVTADQTFAVGDQLFTDVWGAKAAGVKTCLVRPIDKHEEIQIILKRYLEKPVLYFYQRSLRKKQAGERKDAS